MGDKTLSGYIAQVYDGAATHGYTGSESTGALIIAAAILMAADKIASAPRVVPIQKNPMEVVYGPGPIDGSYTRTVKFCPHTEYAFHNDGRRTCTKCGREA